MLKLTQAHLDAIYAHGEDAFPAECCGLIYGSKDGDVRTAVKTVRATNLRAEERNDRYELDPADRMKADKEASEEGLELIGFYHSHPDHESYFSETDLAASEEKAWGEPWLPSTYSYHVTSVKSGKASYSKSFIVVDGDSEEEDMEIVE